MEPAGPLHEGNKQEACFVGTERAYLLPQNNLSRVVVGEKVRDAAFNVHERSAGARPATPRQLVF